MSFTGEETIFYDHDAEEVGQPENLNGVEGSIDYMRILSATSNDDAQDEIYACKWQAEDGARKCLLETCMNRDLPASEAQAMNCSYVKQRMRQEGMKVCKENLAQQINGEPDEIKTLMVLIAPVIARERHA